MENLQSLKKYSKISLLLIGIAIIFGILLGTSALAAVSCNNTKFAIARLAGSGVLRTVSLIFSIAAGIAIFVLSILGSIKLEN
ncbi:Uncharacterised protein [Mycoplasmopsis edwardii]|uniref:Uncharacterized protein n=1 Tax=Mycoplasmopsis edwardii TaxID=53558 RepID=A0A3B0PMZ6_9BACT|nr:hypothetical protein [Mycoplasmopsis edwardii]SYV97140.1 Uncharacterised protein [Mycoplasmopsis edwardii]